MVMVGLAFKLSAVPFHFWAPDVFEGAAAEIGGFLSVASKGAAIALLVRVVVGFGSGPPEGAAGASRPSMSAHASISSAPVTAVAVSAPSAAPSAKASQSTSTWTTLDKGQAQQSIRRYIVYLVAFLAAITATFGNLAAYGQTNIKRLLAYSTIAHAGYMMMPVAAVLLLPAENASIAVGSVAFYVAMYLFMNLGAFTIVALLRNQIRSERIDDYAGLYQHSPGLVICFSIILFSLVGLPPLAGFAAKFVIFSAVIDAGMYLLLTIGVLNSVLSLFYYVKVMKVMIMAPPKAGQPATHLPLLSLGGLCVLALSLPVLVFGVYPNPIIQWAQQSAMSLFRVVP
jgi:NADH-quinone oxidoreductase subunit N